MTVPDIRAPLIRQLRDTHAGDPWFGTSRSALLEGVSAEQAAAHPIAGAHSIWELMLHMTSWTREVLRRLAGGKPAEPASGDWPEVGEPSDAAWTATRVELDLAHAELIAALEALAPARWTAPVGAERDPALGTGVEVAGMLVGMAQHDAYHTGQIGLLRRALADPRRR